MNLLIFRYGEQWHDCAQFVNLIAGYYGKDRDLDIRLEKTDDPPTIRPKYKIVSNDFLLFSLLDLLCSFLIIIHRFHLNFKNKFIA